MQHDPHRYATLDLERPHRTGMVEVVYGEGKTAEQISGIFQLFRDKGQPALATRIDPAKAAAVAALLPGVVYEPVGRLLSLRAPAPPTVGRIAVVCAGTSDLPIAEEAAGVAEFLGNTIERHVDVGIAGIHRILSRVDALRAAHAIIVVAGMDGALPGVVAGLVPAPVIAVPTSVGYGASFGGLAALLTMLNACAPGVAVVNIDNGFGAAVMASRINQLASAHSRAAGADRAQP